MLGFSSPTLSTLFGLASPPTEKVVERTVTPPPDYQRVDPHSASTPVRPTRPARSQTLEDIFALYGDADDVTTVQPVPKSVRKHSRKPALSLSLSASAALTAPVISEKQKSPVVASPPNPHFRSLCRDPLNLVLHSEKGSRRAPHIVITPPAYQETDVYAVEDNATPYQSHAQLAVNDKPMGYLISQTLPTPGVTPESVQTLARTPALKRASKTFQLPSPRRPMDQWACQYTYRACAFLTARKASKVLRSPSGALIAALQPQPLRWTDAAEPLLAWMTQFRGVTVLDSLMPCTVPHIVIAEPPPDDGWTAYDNIAPQQDSRNGQVLSLDWAPRAPVYQSVLNDEWYSETYANDYLSLDEGFSFLEDEDDFDELPSPTRADQSLPSTPPPYSETVWSTSYVDSRSCGEGPGKDQIETTLSPTTGPSLHFFLVQGEASQLVHAAHEFPSSIEHDEIFSPLSPVGRGSPFVHDWLQGPGATMVAV